MNSNISRHKILDNIILHRRFCNGMQNLEIGNSANIRESKNHIKTSLITQKTYSNKQRPDVKRQPICEE